MEFKVHASKSGYGKRVKGANFIGLEDDTNFSCFRMDTERTELIKIPFEEMVNFGGDLNIQTGVQIRENDFFSCIFDSSDFSFVKFKIIFFLSFFFFVLFFIDINTFF